jgi:preprotein translocase subunit SecG
MADDRHGGKGDLAENFRARGYAAPCQYFTALMGECIFNLSVGLGYIRGKEDNANSEWGFGRERLFCGGQQEFAWNSSTDADSVARFAICCDSAAMRKAGKRGKRFGKNVVRSLISKRRNETYSA